MIGLVLEGRAVLASELMVLIKGSVTRELRLYCPRHSPFTFH